MIKAYFHGFHAGSFCLPEFKRDLLLYDRVYFLLPYDDVADVGLSSTIYNTSEVGGSWHTAN